MNLKLKKKFLLYLLIKGLRIADFERIAVDTKRVHFGGIGAICRGARKAGPQSMKAIIEVTNGLFTEEELKWEKEADFTELNKLLPLWQNNNEPLCKVV